MGCLSDGCPSTDVLSGAQTTSVGTLLLYMWILVLGLCPAPLATLTSLLWGTYLTVVFLSWTTMERLFNDKNIPVMYSYNLVLQTFSDCRFVILVVLLKSNTTRKVLLLFKKKRKKKEEKGRKAKREG